MHSVQFVDVAGEKDPTAQRLEFVSQSVDGSLSRSAYPAGHGTHSVAASPAKCPGLHNTHGVDALESRSAIPRSHASHTIDAYSE